MFLSDAEAHTNSTAPEIKEERIIVFIHVHPAGQSPFDGFLAFDEVQVFLIADDQEDAVTAKSSKELHPKANSVMPLAAFDGTDFNSADVLTYTPNSESQSLSLERRPDGSVPVANTVTVLILDAPVVPAKNKAATLGFEHRSFLERRRVH